MTADITVESSSYAAMKSHYILADDLESGTFAMRDQATKWLPMFRGESSDEYSWRLGNAFLKNMLGRGADLIVGQIFKDGVDVSELRLDDLIAEDFDLLGNSIHAYAAKVCRKLLTHGVGHTFTDFRNAGGDSLAEELQGLTRPYASLIEPRDLYFALPKYAMGQEETADARWFANVSEAAGLGDESFNEVRRVYIATEDINEKVGEEMATFPEGAVLYEVWRPASAGAAGYQRSFMGRFEGIEYIPLRTAYASYRGFMRSVPTLEPVASKNLEHWQASSDHNSIVQMSRFEMFYATGVTRDEAEAIETLGPRKKLVSTNEQATFGYVGVSGDAVELSFKDLERITREADERSVEALYKAGSDTATGRKIDLLESLSPAQRVARETERHINQVLEDFGAWLNKDVGRISIDLDFGYGDNEQMIVDALHKARALGDLPRAYYLRRLQELGVIGDDANPDNLAADADNEAAEAGLSANPFAQAGDGGGE
ncbi:MAG: DUF4055 domain-containing protein [Pseudomonadota bacterium]